jgi:hypothetical protein
MAFTSVTRQGKFSTKKLLSQMVINIDKDNRSNFAAAGNFLVGKLPANCIVQNAYAFATTAGGISAVNVGTAEAGDQILAAAAADTAGKTGTAGAFIHTGTGNDVYMGISAALTGELFIVIEYMELGVSTGSLTRV